MASPTNYKPISCTFDDYLEARATLGALSEIEYAESDGTTIRIKAKIKDLIIQYKIELMV